MDIYFNILPEELNKLILFNVNNFKDLLNLKEIFNEMLSSEIFWIEKIKYNLIGLNIKWISTNIFSLKDIDPMILYYYKLYKSYNIYYKEVFGTSNDTQEFYDNGNTFSFFILKIFKSCDTSKLMDDIMNKRLYRYKIIHLSENNFEIRIMGIYDNILHSRSINESELNSISLHFSILANL